jgi:hypothetical protein
MTVASVGQAQPHGIAVNNRQPVGSSFRSTVQVDCPSTTRVLTPTRVANVVNVHAGACPRPLSLNRLQADGAEQGKALRWPETRVRNRRLVKCPG